MSNYVYALSLRRHNPTLSKPGVIGIKDKLSYVLHVPKNKHVPIRTKDPNQSKTSRLDEQSAKVCNNLAINPLKQSINGIKSWNHLINLVRKLLPKLTNQRPFQEQILHVILNLTTTWT